MTNIHPYTEELLSRAKLNRQPIVNLKLRTLLKGFGYYRRNESVISKVTSYLKAGHLDSDFTIDNPPSLDSRIILKLSYPIEIDQKAIDLENKKETDILSRTSLSDIAEKTVAATVEIITEEGKLGSGFIVNKEGLVVTARHVVNNEDFFSHRKVKIRLTDGNILDGTVFRSHRQLDFALIWIEGNKSYPTITLGNANSLRFGQTLLAVGSPSGFSKTVSSGVVSNPAQSYNNIECIQTDTSIDHGNSGGPLVSEEGVVGIAVWGWGNVASAKFAIPINYLTEDIKLSVEKGRNKCLKAKYCVVCGFTDFELPTWYCKNCGIKD